MLAARQVREWGPSVIVAKQGEYGAAMITDEGFFGLPAFPLETVIDPTGAGDSFAGGFMGYIAAHPGEALDHDLLRRAMAYGTDACLLQRRGLRCRADDHADQR